MKLETVKILKIKKETPTVRTFTINKKFNATPGQFAMVWIPGVGERPFCFSRINGNVAKRQSLLDIYSGETKSLQIHSEITVRNIGKFTNEFFSLRKGDLVGIRGPYGNGFRINSKSKSICIISGGVGISPLMPLIENLIRVNKKVIVIMGAKTKKEILFKDRIKKTNANLIITTDDCSEGKGGPCTEFLPGIIKDKKIDTIYACGPEIMMKRVAEIAENYGIGCQLSMERYMKCGIGICGSCAIDPSGLLVCRDGPVFDSGDLKNTEFGKYRRDASGGRIPV